jgi:hypothetical protein
MCHGILSCSVMEMGDSEFFTSENYNNEWKYE